MSSSPVNNASNMASDYDRDALQRMSKDDLVKFLDLDFKDSMFINDETLHPLVPNMGTSDIPVEWGTQCWEIRTWRKLSQEAQDQFLLMLSERPSIDDVAEQLPSIFGGNVDTQHNDAVQLLASKLKELDDIPLDDTEKLQVSSCCYMLGSVHILYSPHI